MLLSYKKIFLFLICLVAFSSCSDEGDVVDSGTYEGTIQSVVPEQTEIYVQTNDDKVLELYFTDDTEVIHNGKQVPYEQLQQDQKVRVTVEKVGQRLNPVRVEILE